jgi:hypothetical protein
MLIFVILFVAANCAAAAPNSAFSTFCCQQEGSSTAECRVGGCQFGTTNLGMFYGVDDCSQCVPNSFPTNTSHHSPTLNVTCSFCTVAGDRCFDSSSLLDHVGCLQTDPNWPLAQFQVSDLSTKQPSQQPYCCYYRPANTSLIAPYQVQNDTGKCSFADSGYALVAFVEHLFDFPCPPVPPCEADCSGHGTCFASQCVCNDKFFGPTCQTMCDSSNCVMGSCYNPSRWTSADYSLYFDDAQSSVLDDFDVFNDTKPSPACHCNSHLIVGPKCDRCAPSHVGPNCTLLCVGAPCNSTYMTGNCTDGGCECVPGYELNSFTKQCECSPKLCNGQCTANNTCECHGHWIGDGCNECECANGGLCSTGGVCMCIDHYGGDMCEQCQAPYFNVAENCSVICVDRTVFNVTYNGSDTVYPMNYCEHDGLCNTTTGNCSCPAHASGAWCETCDNGYFGEKCDTFCDANTTCSALGACNNGTGLCDCFKSGFGGNCTTCKENFYPKGVCTTMCEQATTCSYHGTCSDQGECECYNSVIYQMPDCSVKLWVIIVPCALTVVLFGAFFGVVWWRKKKSVDEYGEPLLGGGW